MAKWNKVNISTTKGRTRHPRVYCNIYNLTTFIFSCLGFILFVIFIQHLFLTYLSVWKGSDVMNNVLELQRKDCGRRTYWFLPGNYAAFNLLLF